VRPMARTTSARRAWQSSASLAVRRDSADGAATPCASTAQRMALEASQLQLPASACPAERDDTQPECREHEWYSVFILRFGLNSKMCGMHAVITCGRRRVRAGR
jgi:hypothetical protein